jgi:shikimate kinase
MKKILLIGYKCSGKSTIGVELSKRLNYSFIDMDDFISKMVGFPIGEYIRVYGIDAFRKREKYIIKKISKFDGNFVISSGGGLPLSVEMNWINKHFLSIYLNVSIDKLYERILLSDNKDRPHFDGLSKEEIYNKIVDEMHERDKLYNKFKIIIDI